MKQRRGQVWVRKKEEVHPQSGNVRRGGSRKNLDLELSSCFPLCPPPAWHCWTCADVTTQVAARGDVCWTPAVCQANHQQRKYISHLDLCQIPEAQ